MEKENKNDYMIDFDLAMLDSSFILDIDASIFHLWEMIPNSLIFFLLCSILFWSLSKYTKKKVH